MKSFIALFVLAVILHDSSAASVGRFDHRLDNAPVVGFRDYNPFYFRDFFDFFPRREENFLRFEDFDLKRDAERPSLVYYPFVYRPDIAGGRIFPFPFFYAPERRIITFEEFNANKIVPLDKDEVVTVEGTITEAVTKPTLATITNAPVETNKVIIKP